MWWPFSAKHKNTKKPANEVHRRWFMLGYQSGFKTGMEYKLGKKAKQTWYISKGALTVTVFREEP